MNSRYMRFTPDVPECAVYTVNTDFLKIHSNVILPYPLNLCKFTLISASLVQMCEFIISFMLVAYRTHLIHADFFRLI